MDFIGVNEVVSGNTILVSQKAFNVTKLVRKWYGSGSGSSSANKGIMLKKLDDKEPVATGSINYDNVKRESAVFAASDYPSGGFITADMYPSGIFYYRDSNGLESYYSYHEQSVGRAGTAYVNDFNGNMVLVHPDAATSGNVFPVSLSHVYNLSRNTEKKRCGNGWRLSAQQELRASGNTDFPYVYTDGDGTNHYFYRDSDNKLKDEDGLGLEITVTSSSNTSEYMTMTTKDHVKMIFKQDGYIRKQIDSHNNTITYNYTNLDEYEDCLTEIVDGTGAKITLEYYEDGTFKGKLYKIKDQIGRSTIFTYEEENLRTITYPDGKATRYGYDDQGVHELMFVKAPDDYEVDFTYKWDCGVRRVETMTEKKGTVIGHQIRVNYQNGNTTIFEEPGLNGTFGNADDRVHTYQFSTLGQPTCIRDKEGNAASYSYYTEGRKNRKVSREGATVKTVNNLLKNTRFEDGLTGWIRKVDALTNYRITVTTDESYIGKKSLCFTKRIASDEWGGILQSVSLEAGTYTLSAYVKKKTNSSGSFQLVVCNNNSSNTVIKSSSKLKGITDTFFNNGWTRETLTFTLSEAKTVRVGGRIVDGLAEVYLTCFQLETGSKANHYNLMENGGFEAALANDTDDMIENGTTEDGITTGAGMDGSPGLRLKGTPGVKKKYYKRIRISGTEPDVYAISGWAKANSTPMSTANPERTFEMRVRVEYTDGTEKYEEIPFNPDITDWQFVNHAFSTDNETQEVGNDGKTAKKAYKAIVICICYEDNENEAVFDGLQVLYDNAGSYSYDAEGNLVSAKTAADRQGFSYDKNNNIAGMMDIQGTAFSYGHDAQHNLRRAGSSEELSYQFEYDNKGNPLRAQVFGGDREGAPVPGRTYYIRDYVSGKYLYAQNGNTTDGTYVVIWGYGGTSAQKWKVLDAGDGYVSLQPQHAIDKRLHAAGTAAGAAITIQTKNDGDSQKFRLKLQEDGTYQISAKNAGDKKVLANNGNATTDGAQITLRTESSTANGQKFILESTDRAYLSDAPENGSVFMIRASHSGQYLDMGSVPLGSTETGALVQNYRNAHDWQSFILEKTEKTGETYPSYYLFPIFEHDHAVTGQYNSSIGYYEAQLHPFDRGNENQMFQFIPVNANTYAVHNVGLARSMDVQEASMTAGSRILITPGDIASYATNKRFILENKGKRIQSSMTYDSLGRNRLTSVDARGKTTRFTYDTDKRMLTAVTDPRGYKVNYSYNGDNDQLQTVSSSLGASVSYEYDTGGRISKITHHETAYNFTYDEFGNSKEVKVGEQALVTNSYYPGNGPIEEVEYGNGYTQSFEYDKKYQLTSVRGKEATETTESVLYTNEYDHYGNVTKHIDKENSITYEYQHDLIGRVSGMKSSKGQRIGIQYDEKNRISQLAHKADGTNVTTEYVYGDVDNTAKEHPGLPYGLKIDGTRRSTLDYDALARVKKRTLNLDNGIYETAYEYADGGESWHTTTLPNSIKHGSNRWSYSYDANGNITYIYKNGGSRANFTYDSLNQLTRENNKDSNKTYCYTYDAGGNLLTRKEYAYTTGTVGTVNKEDTYTYGNTNWKDQLTAFNGQSITYDAIGNPKDYRGMSMTWKQGRRLASLEKDGKTYQYQYNSEGIRIGKKRLNGTIVENITKYYLNGNKVMTMDDGTNTVHFIYDQDGKLFAMKVGSTMYYYLLNLQGDVIGLIDSSGNEMVSYCYDAWGRLLSTTDNSGVGIGALNPFRYRGYFYDAETGFYYSNSRYYDPEVGRFINADTTDVLTKDKTSITHKNLYAYANNNPVNWQDDSGRFPVVVWKVGAVALDVGVALLVAKFEAELNGEEFTGKDALMVAGTTAVSSVVGLKTSGLVVDLVEIGMDFVYNCYKEGTVREAAGETMIDWAFSKHLMGAFIDKRIEVELKKVTDFSSGLDVARNNFYRKTAAASFASGDEVIKAITTKQEKTPEYIKVKNGKLMM